MKSHKSPFAALFFLGLFAISVSGFSQCKEIRVEAKVIHTTDDSTSGTIELEIHGISQNEITINVFGPRRNNRLGISDLVIKDLPRGNYLVVISGREEGNNICPLSKNITIN